MSERDGEEGDGALLAMLLNNIQRPGVTTICVSVEDARRMLNWREQFDVVRYDRMDAHLENQRRIAMVVYNNLAIDDPEALDTWFAEFRKFFASYRAKP